jgi:hypothetical protein
VNLTEKFSNGIICLPCDEERPAENNPGKNDHENLL